jgi:hypothetical protein
MAKWRETLAGNPIVLNACLKHDALGHNEIKCDFSQYFYRNFFSQHFFAHIFSINISCSHFFQSTFPAHIFFNQHFLLTFFQTTFPAHIFSNNISCSHFFNQKIFQQRKPKSAIFIILILGFVARNIIVYTG